MNTYGLQAQSHWQTHAPRAYAELEDPTAFFEQLGSTVAAQVAVIRSQMESKIPGDLPYLERVGQLRMAQKQAEEIAMEDHVFSAVTPEISGLVEELERLLAELPHPWSVEEALTQIHEEAEGVLDVETQAEYDRLLALLSLVNLSSEPEQMSEVELSDRIAALRSHAD